jgi:hypothetical protein
MTIDIYPAFIQGNEIVHADNWDKESTLNLANANFFGQMDLLGMPQTVSPPGHILLRTMEMALATAPFSPYNARLRKLCAIARVKKAHVIAFS